MPEALALVPRPSESLASQWLALALTPRLGPTMRRLVEHFGGMQNIFKASLTELVATRHANRLGAIARHRPVHGIGA
jgi:hypothetical protein